MDRRSAFTRNAVERKIYDLHKQADILGNKLENLNSPVPAETIPDGVSMKALEAIIHTRQAQLSALQLGVPFQAGERAYTIETRILEALPEILDQKGIGLGAIVQKNHGGMATDPHEVVGVFADDAEVELRPLLDDSTYRYNAIMFACMATPYQDPSAQ